MSKPFVHTKQNTISSCFKKLGSAHPSPHVPSTFNPPHTFLSDCSVGLLLTWRSSFGWKYWLWGNFKQWWKFEHNLIDVMGFLIQNSSVDMIKYLPGPRWQTILYESQIFWVLSGNRKYSRKATCASQTTWPRAPQTPLSRLQLQIFGRDISRSRHLDVATQRSRFEHSSSQSRRPLVKMSRYQPATL